MRQIILIGSPWRLIVVVFLSISIFPLLLNGWHFYDFRFSQVNWKYFIFIFHFSYFPSLSLPVLFHFTFSHFIYQNSARRDRATFHLARKDGRVLTVLISRGILQLLSRQGSFRQILNREITEIILILSLANIGTSCFRSVFIILCLTIKSFFYLYLLLKIKSVYEPSSRLPSYTGFRRIGDLGIASSLQY